MRDIARHLTFAKIASTVLYMLALNVLQGDELPVLHRRNHSITSSARMRSSHVEGGFRSSGIAEAHSVACERGMLRSR
jgi:hypothetical protein